MVNLKQKARVIEKSDRFIHKITATYPKENVAKMIASWDEAVVNGQEWLDNFEIMKETTITEGFNQIDAGIVAKRKNIEDFEKMSDEDKFKKLLAMHEKDKKAFFESEKNVEKTKEELKAALTRELEGYKVKIQNDVAEKLNAKKVWENPEKKS